MRPNMPQRIRKKCYPLLLAKYPEVCSNCQKTVDELHLSSFNPENGTGGLEIHHIRYDVPLDNPDYQRFMCHGCNHKKELCRSELERYTRELSASMISNVDKHQIFEEWFSLEMTENNYRMPMEDVVAGGSYVSGANITTVHRWVRTLISKPAPFSRAVIDGVETVYLKGREFFRPPPKDIQDDSSDYI